MEGVIVLARPRKSGWMPLQVSEILTETHDCKTFRFIDGQRGGRQFDYRAGQYLTFRFDDLGGRPLARSYTMSSSPCQKDFVSITVKRTTGGVVSNWLYDNLQPAMILRARGALGKFCYDANNDPPHLFMIAAGSGIAPFLSISRQYMTDNNGAPQTMQLLVSQRTHRDLIAWQELQTFAQHDHYQLYLTLSGERAEPATFHGRINDQILAQVIGKKLNDTCFMLCGPEQMIETTRSYLSTNGVADQHIKTESYST